MARGRKKKILKDVVPVDAVMVTVAELDALAGVSDSEKYSVSQSELAAISGTPITKIIQKWETQGCPVTGSGKDKRYDLREVLKWLAGKKVFGANQYTDGESLGDGGLRDQKLTAEIEKIKIANEERLGRLVPVDQLISDWKLAASTLQTRMLAIVRPYGDEATRAMEQGLGECARLIGQGGEA